MAGEIRQQLKQKNTLKSKRWAGGYTEPLSRQSWERAKAAFRTTKGSLESRSRTTRGSTAPILPASTRAKAAYARQHRGGGGGGEGEEEGKWLRSSVQRRPMMLELHRLSSESNLGESNIDMSGSNPSFFTTRCRFSTDRTSAESRYIRPSECRTTTSNGEDGKREEEIVGRIYRCSRRCRVQKWPIASPSGCWNGGS